MDYQLPPSASIGHVHLKVSKLEQSVAFYVNLLGFRVTQKIGDEVVFLSAGSYHHRLALNTWYSKDSKFKDVRATGLFHVAILLPTREDLAQIFKRLLDYNYPIQGTADHGVSEAIYLSDPDHNGVELYWDKPQDDWPYINGKLNMYTKSLNHDSLLNALKY